MSTDGALKLVPAPADPAAEPLPAGLAWISLEEAARRAGLNVGSTRRLCYQWEGAGRARRTLNPATGRERWEVHESADPRLAPVKHADQLAREFDLNALTQRQRDTYALRCRVLDRWELARAAAVDQGRNLHDARADFCERLRLEDLTVSPRTLIRWEGLRKLGPEHLVDGRSEVTARAAEAKAGDPFLAEVCRRWLRQSRPKLKTCYEQVRDNEAADNGWFVPSLKTVERHVKSLPPQLVIKLRDGETAFTNRVLPHVRRDYSSIATNDVWCCDHHQFDVVVRVGERRDPATGEVTPLYARPWITPWQDLRSRRIVGYRIFAHAPNQTTILHALRSACLAHGLPAHVIVDNGKDFDSYTLQGVTKWQRKRVRVEGVDERSRGVLGMLKVGVTHALPYNAKAKPIERFFGTVCTRFSKQFATYCGRNPQEKPEELGERLAAGHAVTLAEFTESFAVWLEADYHHRLHEGDGLDGELTPAQAFDRFFTNPKRVALREDLELLIQRTSQPLAVTANGVTWEGLAYGGAQVELLYPYFGKRVYLRVDTDDDVSRATAWTLDDKLIGLLTLNNAGAYGRIGAGEIREAKNRQKRVKEITRQYRDLGPDRAASTLDLVGMRRLAEAREKANPAPEPSGMKLVRTPLEGQVARLEAMKNQQALRKAAGGEGGEQHVGLYDDDGDDVAAGPAGRIGGGGTGAGGIGLYTDGEDD